MKRGLREGEAAIRKALELNPQYPIAHFCLGCIYLAQSKPKEALAEMQKESDERWRLDGFTAENAEYAETAQSFFSLTLRSPRTQR